jgi:uncharacterized protein (DUF1697 family)
MKYVALLRGINVGGKNKVPMAALKECFEEVGFSNVMTYIASGNVLLESDKKHNEVQALIEEILPKKFRLDAELIRVLVLSHEQLKDVIDNKPKGFGEQPGEYHSDVIFLMGVNPDEAMAVFDPKEGVDTVWLGKAVIYSQRLSAMRTKSRLSKIVGTAPYKQMTIRTYGTVTKLFELMQTN